MEDIKDEILRVASLPDSEEKTLLLNAWIDYIFYIKDEDIINIHKFCLN